MSDEIRRVRHIDDLNSATKAIERVQHSVRRDYDVLAIDSVEASRFRDEWKVKVWATVNTPKGGEGE